MAVSRPAIGKLRSPATLPPSRARISPPQRTQHPSTEEPDPAPEPYLSGQNNLTSQPARPCLLPQHPDLAPWLVAANLLPASGRSPAPSGASPPARSDLSLRQ